MLRNRYNHILLALFLTSISMLVVRIDITEKVSRNHDDILIDKQDIYTVSIKKFPWWENFRWFPFHMGSFPYNHTSTKVSWINIVYNFIFYFLLILIIKELWVYLSYKKMKKR